VSFTFSQFCKFCKLNHQYKGILRKHLTLQLMSEVRRLSSVDSFLLLFSWTLSRCSYSQALGRHSILEDYSLTLFWLILVVASIQIFAIIYSLLSEPSLESPLMLIFIPTIPSSNLGFFYYAPLSFSNLYPLSSAKVTFIFLCGFYTSMSYFCGNIIRQETKQHSEKRRSQIFFYTNRLR
jgi:hypothetical protein